MKTMKLILLLLLTLPAFAVADHATGRPSLYPDCSYERGLNGDLAVTCLVPPVVAHRHIEPAADDQIRQHILNFGHLPDSITITREEFADLFLAGEIDTNVHGGPKYLGIMVIVR